MTVYQNFLPPVPEDTYLAATGLYGKGHIYLRLGDALEQLLNGLEPVIPITQAMGSRVLDTHIRPALLTIFQYVEELTNEQILEAVRNRFDLKYALHLPLNAPIPPLKALCEFHQALYANPSHQRFLQSLLDRLIDFGLFSQSTRAKIDTHQVLSTVCSMSQLAAATNAMHLALERLAVADPEWLRKTARPYWYDRYNRGSRLTATSFSDPGWNSRIQEIVGDMQYLLKAVDGQNNPLISALPEIQFLNQIIQEQFLSCVDETDSPLNQERMVTECNLCKQILETQEVQR